MDLDILKVYTATYVAESDIPHDTKLELIEFVRVAEKAEILSLLATGDTGLCEDEDLLEVTELMIAESVATWRMQRAMKKSLKKDGSFWKGMGAAVSKLDQHERQKKMAGKVAVGVVVAAAAAGLAKLVKDGISVERACKGTSGAEKQKCIRMFYAKRDRAKMNLLRQKMGQCAQTKKPDVCKAKIQAKMSKLNVRATKLEN